MMNHFRQRGIPLAIAGDGRYDSPGHSAEYCTYTVVDTESNQLIDFYVAQKQMAEYSSKMEPLGAKMILHR